MIVMRTPKGWTCPKEIDGKREEGYWRAHQVPMSEIRGHPEHVRVLEAWMKSYRPEELFDATGRLKAELAALAPSGTRRMSANPHTNGGSLLRELRLPDFRDYAVEVTSPGSATAEATRVMGTFLRDVMKLNLDARNFRLFSPDESNSNRWQDVLEVTNRAWVAETFPYDDHLAPDGRVMEMLSEHQCQGWLEGYLLTGRHGFFSCYEAFIHIIDSMFNQHAKWLKVCRDIEWRRPIASLNYLLVQSRLAAGPQRLLPPGSGVHRSRDQQEGGGRARLPAAGRQLPPVGDRTLPDESKLRERGRRREAAGAAMADDGPGDQALHRRAWASGNGRATILAASRTW